MLPGLRQRISFQNRPEFGDHVRRYYEYIRENDLTLTHSLINLQRSRNIAGTFNLSDDTALRVVRETDAGIVVRGARILATLGPLADEIGVYSPRMGRMTEAQPLRPHFAIPCGTPGLKFLCRESFDVGSRTLSIPSDRASRRWMPSSSSTMCRPMGTRVSARRCRHGQRHGLDHALLQPHGASGRRQKCREVRAGPGDCPAHDACARQRPSPHTQERLGSSRCTRNS